MGPCALTEARLERKKPAEPTTQGEDWEVVSSYFNQGSTYAQAGQALHANLPIPGTYRVRIVSGEGPAQAAGLFTGDIDFTKEKGWPDPGQLAYRATNMNLTNAWKRRYDTIVVTDKVYKPIARKLRKWVSRQDGNLVLTDRALGMLQAMKVVEKGSVGAATDADGAVRSPVRPRRLQPHLLGLPDAAELAEVEELAVPARSAPDAKKRGGPSGPPLCSCSR